MENIDSHKYWEKIRNSQFMFFQMHPLSSAAYQASLGYGVMDANVQQQSPPEVETSSHHDPSNGGDQVCRSKSTHIHFYPLWCLLTFIDFQNRPSSNYTDINQILDQILNITDQSLDEAQVKAVVTVNFILIFSLQLLRRKYQSYSILFIYLFNKDSFYYNQRMQH